MSVDWSYANYEIDGEQNKRERGGQGVARLSDTRLKHTILTISWAITALPALIGAGASANYFIARLGETKAIVQTDVEVCAACARLAG